MKSIKNFKSKALLNSTSILKNNELNSFVGGTIEKTQMSQTDCYNDENVERWQTSGRYHTQSTKATKQNPGDIEYGACSE
jgi:hypothetical protein